MRRRDFLSGLLGLALSPPLLAQSGLAAFRRHSAIVLEVPESWLDWPVVESIWRSGVRDELSLYRAWYPHLTWKILEWSVEPTFCPPQRPRWEDAPGA